MTIELERVTDDQQEAVRLLESRGYTRRQIGQAIGYGGKKPESAINNLMSADRNPLPLIPHLRLATLVAREGAFSLHYLPQGISAVPQPQGAQGDGCVDDDLADMMEIGAQFRQAHRAGDAAAMRRCTHRLIKDAAGSWMAEADYLETHRSDANGVAPVRS